MLLEEKCESYLNELKGIARKAIQKNKFEKALAALASCCSIHYSMNQIFTDNEIEQMLLSVAKSQVVVPEGFETCGDVLLFYDGFGLDLRGWAASFARALSSLDYKLIYVAPEKSKGKIPHIESEVNKGHGRIVYIDMDHGYTRWVSSLNKVFLSCRPHTAFFYTKPCDVAGTTVFNAYINCVNRIQIDLTDHAFWIGVNAFDYAIESRPIGISNMVYNRGVDLKKVVVTDCTPYINREAFNKPFPFDIEKDKFVFSGGALYKTFGDKELLYYKIVSTLLDYHPDLKFIYAGEGDDSELAKLIKQYPDRVFYIHERPDFFRLFENCLFFLNTYPMFGGLMMRYAALSGRIPLTLKHGSDQDGILYNQNKRGFQFDSFEELISEGNKLIVDEQYRKNKEKKLVGACLSEDDFARNLKSLIEYGSIGEVLHSVERFDTFEFQREYLNRLDFQSMILNAIPNRRNASLIMNYPVLFIKKAVRRVYNG